MAASFGVGPRKPKPRLLLAKAAKQSLERKPDNIWEKINAEERMVVQKFHRYFYETFIFEIEMYSLYPFIKFEF